MLKENQWRCYLVNISYNHYTSRSLVPDRIVKDTTDKDSAVLDTAVQKEIPLLTKYLTLPSVHLRIDPAAWHKWS